jgi:hypothetical protein
VFVFVWYKNELGSHFTRIQDIVSGYYTLTEKKLNFPHKGALDPDDGFIKAKLSVALQVLAELKHVLKLDGDLELNVSTTSILPRASLPRQPSMWRRTSYMVNVSGDVLLASFCS